MYHDTNRVKSHVQLEHTAGRLEVSHFETDPPNILTFSVLRGRRAVATGVESDLAMPSNELGAQMQDVYMLDGDTEEWGSKLEFYTKKMAQYFINAEPTNFVRQTVTLAWELGQLQEVGKTPSQ